jgi:putative spermidine/putrescine transport system permease protein
VANKHFTFRRNMFPRHTESFAGLALLGLMVVLPVAWIIGYSLAYSIGGIGMFSKGWTTEHWRAIIESGEFWRSLWYSAGISMFVTGASTGLALMIVLTIPEIRESKRIPALIFLPLATPAVVVAVIVYQMLNPGGLLARMAQASGMIESPADFPVLVNDPWAIGIVIAGTCSALPLLTLFFLKTWTTARIQAYCRLAESLGSTQRQARWRIARPMLLHRARSLILLTFLWNLGSYEIPLLLGRQSPQMYSVLIHRRSGQYNLLQRPEAFALASTYLLLVSAGVVVLLIWRRKYD